MTNYPMGHYPKGDTALSRAITTGAPVATNDKQAAELTQRFKVGDSVAAKLNSTRVGTVVGVGGVMVHVRWPDGWEEPLFQSDLMAIYEARPTPPPTPPASSGGEWKVTRATLNGGWYVDHPDHASLHCITKSFAELIAQRLNAADAMERALKSLHERLACDNDEQWWSVDNMLFKGVETHITSCDSPEVAMRLADCLGNGVAARKAIKDLLDVIHDSMTHELQAHHADVIEAARKVAGGSK